MRRSLAVAALVLTAAFATPAGAEDLVKKVKDTLGNECMDCIPPRCQIINNCR